LPTKKKNQSGKVTTPVSQRISVAQTRSGESRAAQTIAGRRVSHGSPSAQRRNGSGFGDRPLGQPPGPLQVVAQLYSRGQLRHCRLPLAHDRRRGEAEEPVAQGRLAANRAAGVEKVEERGRAENVEIAGVGVLRLGAECAPQRQAGPRPFEPPGRLLVDRAALLGAVTRRAQLGVVADQTRKPTKRRSASPASGREPDRTAQTPHAAATRKASSRRFATRFQRLSSASRSRVKRSCRVA
jgi:hypothetical protein